MTFGTSAPSARPDPRRSDDANGTDAARRFIYTALLGIALLALFAAAVPVEAQQAAKEPAYRSFPLIGSRLAVWAIAQLHLNFAAFILGVPIFAVIIEVMGWRTGDARYDWLAHELVKLTFAAFSTTALLGAAMLFLLIGYYPRFWAYMSGIFCPCHRGTPCVSRSLARTNPMSSLPWWSSSPARWSCW